MDHIICVTHIKCECQLIFRPSQITCSKAHEGSGHEHVDLVIGTGQVCVRIVDIG